MEFSITRLMQENSGKQFDLHTQFMNEQMPKVLKTIGYAKNYVRGEGAYLWDEDGKMYLDFLSGFGAFSIGRYHPVVLKAIRDVLEFKPPTLVQMDTPLLAGLLAERLVAITPPNLKKVYFTNSGTESVEAAIKFGRQATGRDKILYLKKAFHGLTCGSLSLCGASEFREGFGPLLAGFEEVALNDLPALEEKLSRRDVGIFIVEPIQGKGVYVAEKHYLLAAQDLCKKYGTLLVADEIQTGLGRTGAMFAFEHSGIEQDMVLLSKSLAGGLIPCGAVVMTPDICNATFNRMDRCYVQSSTFKMNALAMAAALATLHVLATESIVQNAAHNGEILLRGLNNLVPKFECFGAVRGRGLMIGLEMNKPNSMGLKMGWNLLNKMSTGLFSQVVTMMLMEKHQILTQVAGNNMDIIKILPPLIISEKEVHYFLNAMEKVLEEVHQFPGPLWSFGSSLVKHAVAP